MIFFYFYLNQFNINLMVLDKEKKKKPKRKTSQNVIREFSMIKRFMLWRNILKETQVKNFKNNTLIFWATK